jgi:hypothetical protein
MEGDLHLLKIKTNEIQKENDEQKLIIIDLTKKLSRRDSADSDVKQFLRSSEGEETSLYLGESGLQGEEEAKREGEEARRGREEARRGVYQVDREGYLMDGDGKYLLKANDEMIKLSNQQISALITSNVVQIIDS